jgi:hypothetical protein
MRIIIEFEPGTQVTTSSPQVGISSQADADAAPINAGPPRIDSNGAPVSPGQAEGAENVGGPPEELVAEIEAARARARGDSAPTGTARPN